MKVKCENWIMKSLWVFLCALTLVACDQEKERIESLAQLNDSRYTIGYDEGHSSGTILPKVLPNARLYSFNDVVTGYEAVRQGKVDAFAFERLQMELAIRHGLKGVRILPETLGDTVNVAVGISRASKIPDLKKKINQFIRQIQKDGTLEQAKKRWLLDGVEDMPDIPEPENPDMLLQVGTSGIVTPFSYYRGNELTGFDIEMIRRLALWMNARVKIKIYDYNSIVAAAVSGDIDCILANLNETEERKEKIDYSEPLIQVVNAVVVRDEKGTGDGAGVPETRGKRLKYTSVEEMKRNENLRLGMQTGFVFVDKETRRMFPKAKIEYYKSTPDMAYLVANGKLDGFINDEPVIRYCALENPNLGYIHSGFEPMDLVVLFPKTPKGATLRDEMNVFIERLRSKDSLNILDSLWLSHDEEKKVVDIPKAMPGKPTLHMGTSAETAPLEYVKDGKIVGYEIDLVARFCREKGYGLDIQNVPFESLILGVENGNYEFAASALSATAAIQEKFHISNSIYVSECVMAVQLLEDSENSAAAPDKKGMFESLSESFERTFVRESRWKLVVDGIKVTIFISVLSAILGTLLGFGICMLRRSGNRVANALALSFIRIMQGTPMVVLLMILFYIVFARSGLDGVWVAIIGFAMNFGAYVSEMMRTGIEAVDKGQMEAALALGYRKPRAFFKIVLPQAARHFLPVYQGEFISLVKMTSVVGYIAIQDLTKASDIIRSRTYEAFFPLVTTAIIYFLIAWVLTRVLTSLQKRLDPKNRRNRRQKF